MTTNGLLQLTIYLGILLACVKPLGFYGPGLFRIGNVLGPYSGCERLLYRLCGIDQSAEMTWRQYSVAVLTVSLLSFLSVYA